MEDFQGYSQAPFQHTQAPYIYIGSPQNRYFAPQVIDLLRRCIHEGDHLSFRHIQEIYRAFDEERCVYALDNTKRVIGFSYVEILNSSKRPAIIHCSMVIEPYLRNSGLGRQIILTLFDFASQKYPHHDLLSMSANPVVIHLDKEYGLKEISHRELWENYGVDPIQDIENRPHATWRFKSRDISRNIFDNIEIFDELSGNVGKNMVFLRATNPPSGNGLHKKIS